MPDVENLTVTLPAELAIAVKEAVELGDYASSSEAVAAALRDWSSRRAIGMRELTALKADVEAGVADIAAGRVRDFDVDRIVERGRQQSAGRSASE